MQADQKSFAKSVSIYRNAEFNRKLTEEGNRMRLSGATDDAVQQYINQALELRARKHSGFFGRLTSPLTPRGPSQIETDIAERRQAETVAEQKRLARNKKLLTAKPTVKPTVEDRQLMQHARDVLAGKKIERPPGREVSSLEMGDRTLPVDFEQWMEKAIQSIQNGAKKEDVFNEFMKDKEYRPFKDEIWKALQ